MADTEHEMESDITAANHDADTKGHGQDQQIGTSLSEVISNNNDLTPSRRYLTTSY
jgi:hypothetical protein